MPCFLVALSTAFNLLKQKYRIHPQPKDYNALEDWLRAKLSINEAESHEKIKEKLDQLKKKSPSRFRQLEYEFIQFIKHRQRKTQQKEKHKQKKPLKTTEEEAKKKEIEAMYQ
ncbi:MAG: hypothetical protein ACXADB_10845 [Candidatus Hermodarchaeia archaeon]|jgi:hypothetical protein